PPHFSKRLQLGKFPVQPPTLYTLATISTITTILTTGSTRGIGLAFTKHYAKAGWNVIDTAPCHCLQQTRPWLLRRVALIIPRKYRQLHDRDYRLLQAKLFVLQGGTQQDYSISSVDLQPSGIVVVSVHPGYVDTDMTHAEA
ncbi:hypothetical protein L916_13203, partial [Phytophthora nicotianae]